MLPKLLQFTRFSWGKLWFDGFALSKQARKPRSYASPKLRLTHSLTHLLTGVKCRATSVAKNVVGAQYVQ